MPQAQSPEPVRVLVIRRRYLGDIVLLGSFFRNLKLHWPRAHVSLLGEPAYAGVAALNADVDRVLALPKGIRSGLALARELRSTGFSHVFDLDNSDRTALLTRATGAPFRATLHLENVPRHLAWCYTHTAFIGCTDYSAQSITETYLALLAPAGVPVASRECRLKPREAELAVARRLVAGNGPRLLVHPGSRSAFRMWPAGHFAAVCDRIQEGTGAQSFLVSGPGEEDRIQAIRNAARSHIVALDPTPGVPAFAALVSRFDVLLCHDSGPMHVAAAVGTPVVALFGSQSATVWGPLGPDNTVLQPPLPCIACVAPGSCISGDSYRNYCVRNITVDRVVEAVSGKLRSRRSAT